MVSRNQSAILLAFLIVTIAASGQTTTRHRSRSGKQNTDAPSAASATYVGTAACSRCHLGIANTFAKASMGHSLTRITPDFLKTLPIETGDAAKYTDPKSGHDFAVHANDGKLYQTESEIGPDGNEVFSNTHELSWIIGTGENGFGALLNRDDFLFQAPLTHYTSLSAWRLSPNYEVQNQSFNRLIPAGCISCHSGRSQPVPNVMGKFQPTPFSQISVGCENCHGPGSAHVQFRGEGGGPVSQPGHPAAADPTIVNPARLTGQLSDDICMSCHQIGDMRVLQAGKTALDFRPGEPLEHTLFVFQIPPTRENPPQEDHLEHYYSMSLSKCFRATQSTAAPLRCITCHDPHVEPAAAEAPVFFNARCITCHDPHIESAKSCTALLATRQQTTPIADNCIGCHMPKRESHAISHAGATNHRIVRSSDEPFPDEAFNQTTAAMPDLLLVNPAGVRGPKSATTPALIRLEAYGSLMRSKPELEAPWRKLLGELEISMPGAPSVRAALGFRDLKDDKLSEAVANYSEALRLDPTQLDSWVFLSQAQSRLGQAEPAIDSAKKAVELAPFIPALQKTLVFRLIKGNRYEEAKAAMEKYLKTFPEDDSMRQMLATVNSE
jgi:Tetratricopeptide repeat/Cytochrome c554 and c-prime